MVVETRLLALIIGIIAAAPTQELETPLVNTLESSRSEISAFLGALREVRTPEKVEGLPVESWADLGSAPGFRVVEEPVALIPREASTLSRTLLNVDSYGAGISACLFSPAVAFRFHKGTRAVDALVCFQCNELIFQESGGKPLSYKMQLGKGRRVLLATAQRLFPENKALQALKK